MATITEDYVSFEVAKLLKEKGFDVKTINFWHIVPSETCNFNALEKIACVDINEPEYSENYYPMITLQMAMKWLREEHNIHIGINPISGNGYNATIYDVADFDDYGIISDTEFFFHVEEACEAAIKYCLENLI